MAAATDQNAALVADTIGALKKLAVDYERTAAEHGQEYGFTSYPATYDRAYAGGMQAAIQMLESSAS